MVSQQIDCVLADYEEAADREAGAPARSRQHKHSQHKHNSPVRDTPSSVRYAGQRRYSRRSTSVGAVRYVRRRLHRG